MLITNVTRLNLEGSKNTFKFKPDYFNDTHEKHCEQCDKNFTLPEPKETHEHS